ncbi:MAG: hypothetical protein EBR02_07480 [Alphaproteobacteria bacterium]|nr:hypothetical protein [Alphaproteobacteria bacterium]
MAASSLLPTAGAMAPGALMFAGAAPMMLPSAPTDVRIAGVLLSAAALILLDLQSGGKLGDTKKIVNAMRKIPGFKDADEDTIIGSLFVAATTAMGIGGIVETAGQPNGMPGGIKVACEFVYMGGSLLSFKEVQKAILKKLGVITVDEHGVERTHENAGVIVRLVQQLTCLVGAGLLTGYGSQIDFKPASDAAMFTGYMFMLSNGVAISQLAMSKPFTGEMLTEMEKLAKDMGKLKPEEVPSEVLLKRMQKAFERFQKEGRIAPHPEGVSLPTLSPADLAAALGPVLARINAETALRR